MNKHWVEQSRQEHFHSFKETPILFRSYSTPTGKRTTKLAFSSSVVSGGESFMRSDSQDDTQRKVAIPETTKEIKK